MNVRTLLDRNTRAVRRPVAVALIVLLGAGVLLLGKTRTNDRVNVGAAADNDGSIAGAITHGAASDASAQSKPGGRDQATGSTVASGHGGAGPGGLAPSTASRAGSPRRLPVAAGTKGVTDTTIRVGLVTGNSEAAITGVNALTGGNQEGGGDLSARNAAVIKYINSTGGIAGRKVVPVTYTYNVQNHANPSTRQQE